MYRLRFGPCSVYLMTKIKILLMISSGKYHRTPIICQTKTQFLIRAVDFFRKKNRIKLTGIFIILLGKLITSQIIIHFLSDFRRRIFDLFIIFLKLLTRFSISMTFPEGFPSFKMQDRKSVV